MGGGGYGRTVLIKHGNGWKTRYAHLKYGSLEVATGDKVSQGPAHRPGGQDRWPGYSHLHYEQIRTALSSTPVEGVLFDPDDVHYIKSTNNC